MDTQHACLSKIVLDGDILPFIDAKIGPQFFPDGKHLQVWNLIIKHYQGHGKAPSAGVVHKAYPTYKFTEYPEPTDYYLRQLQQDRTRMVLTNGVQEFANRLGEDEGPEIGTELELILRKALNIAAHEVTQGRDTDFFLGRQAMMDRLRLRQENPGYLRGITTGFDSIDRVTGGLQEQQLVTLIGLAKAGKSSILLKMALQARLVGHPVLFLTFEMSTEEQEDRLLSLLSGVSLTKILTGTLSKKELEKIDRAVKLRESLAGFIITSDISSAMTISGLQAKITMHRPSLCCIDGMYLMEDENGESQGSPQALTNLTRGCKRVAQLNNLAMLMTTQASAQRSRGGLTSDSAAYSRSFVQDSDVLLGVEAPEEVEHVARIKVLASRSGPKADIFIVYDWDRGEIKELPKPPGETTASKPGTEAHDDQRLLDDDTEDELEKDDDDEAVA